MAVARRCDFRTVQHPQRPSCGCSTKNLSQKSFLPWREKVRMRGIVSVTLTSILSHPGRGGRGKCFEIVSKGSATFFSEATRLPAGCRFVPPVRSPHWTAVRCERSRIRPTCRWHSLCWVSGSRRAPLFDHECPRCWSTPCPLWRDRDHHTKSVLRLEQCSGSGWPSLLT